LLDVIGEDCINRNIQVYDSPDFVYDILKNPIPFSKNKKFTSLNLNYEHEAKN